MHDRTLTAPERNNNVRDFQPRKPWGQNRGARTGGYGNAKKPSGHQAALSKGKGSAEICIKLLQEDRNVEGRLVDSDRYTITVQEAHMPEPEVFYKHAIASYILTPDAENAE